MNLDKIKRVYEEYGNAVAQELFGLSSTTICKYAKQYKWKKAKADVAAKAVVKLIINQNTKF